MSLSESGKILLDIHKELTEIKTNQGNIKEVVQEVKAKVHAHNKFDKRIDRLEQSHENTKWIQRAISVPVIGLIVKFFYEILHR